MRDQYIPDMTERFPEGLDGVDYTDSYFAGHFSRYSYDLFSSVITERGYEPPFGEDPVEKEYLDKMNIRINNVQTYSDEELQHFMDEMLNDYDPEEIEACKYSVEYALKSAIEQEWDRRRNSEQSEKKSYFIAWYNDTNNAEGEDKYEIYHAATIEDAINLAKADLGDVDIDVELYEP